MKLTTAIIVAFLIACAPVQASTIPQPMRDAVDDYAIDYATFQGWDYVDRSASIHGDYRRARFTLIYTVPQDDPNAEVIMEVEAHAIRCAPKVYAVSTPLDPNYCLPKW